MEIQGYNMPEDLHYHGENTWAKLEEDGTVRVGMDDFYQKQAGETTYIDLPFEGDEVQEGDAAPHVAFGDTDHQPQIGARQGAGGVFCPSRVGE